MSTCAALGGVFVHAARIRRPAREKGYPEPYLQGVRFRGESQPFSTPPRAEGGVAFLWRVRSPFPWQHLAAGNLWDRSPFLRAGSRGGEFPGRLHDPTPG